MSDSGTLVYNLQANRAPAYAINGMGGNVTVNGSGKTLTLTTVNGYTGVTTIGSGATLQLGNGTTDGSIANTSGVNDSGTLVYNLQANRAPAYAINGTGGNVTVNGSGQTLTLTTVNGYTGATTIGTGATLQLGNGTTDGSILNTSGVTDNGTLVYNLASTDRNAAYTMAALAA